MTLFFIKSSSKKKVREKTRECHNHKPQPFPDPKRKSKPTNPNKHKSNKRTKITNISSHFPKRGNRNTKRTEKHKNKMTHGKTYNKSPRRINQKATKSKTNTGTLQITRTGIKSQTNSMLAQLRLLAWEFPTLEGLMNLGKGWPDDSDFSFDRIFIRLAGNENSHKILDEFVFGTNRTIHRLIMR